MSFPTGARSSASGNRRHPRHGGTQQPSSTTVYSSGYATDSAARTAGSTAGSRSGSMFGTSAFTKGRQAPGTSSRPARTTDSRGADTRRTEPTTGAARGDHPRSADRQPRTERPTRDDRGASGGTDRQSRTRQAPARPSGGRQDGRTGQSQPRADRVASERSTQPARSAPAAALFGPGTVLSTNSSTPVDVSFAELGVPEALLAPLTALGAIDPFPIQAATLRATLAGRDVLGRGRTGSGKTIAFAIPLVARLTGGRRTPQRPRGLVLLPTRELALQVARTIEPLAKAAGLRTTVVFGGVGQGPQVSALRAGVDIVIACPGRLEDLINQKLCSLADVEVTVLDEADHMADLGFLPGVRRLLKGTRPDGQRLLFSATLDNGISVLVNDFLSDPAVHAVDDETSPIESMTHHIFAVASADRGQVVRELAAGGGRRLLFSRTKHAARKLATTLSKNGIPAVDLHGNLSQNARERNLEAFSAGTAKVLVATDIAARGIHVDDIELVVHVDPPVEHKAYLHRSGRTARAGAGGTVVTVMTPDQATDVRKMMKLAGINATTTEVRPGHPAIASLVR